jgi:4-aminobutyrate aminotransferase-like enzyme
MLPTRYPENFFSEMNNIIWSTGHELILADIVNAGNCDLEPDMIAMGKGIGNGYPVSVAAISGKAAGELENHHFHYSQSHQNDPLGATVITEVIGTIITFTEKYGF